MPDPNIGSFINWDFMKQNVGAEANTGEIVTTSSTVILAGPSRLDHLKTGALGSASNATLFPLGRIMSFDYRQVKPNQPAFELGSRRAYLISGKPLFSGDVRSFVLYKNSLLRLAYGYYANNQGNNSNVYMRDIVGDSMMLDKLKLKPGYAVSGGPNALGNTDNPAFWSALASEIFTVPVGLCVLFRSNRSRAYGAIYLEDVLFNSLMVSMAAHDVITGEATSFDATLCVPVQLTRMATDLTTEQPTA